MDTTAIRDTWLMFQREHGCSIDRMLCSPDLRRQFLDNVHATTGDTDEQSILWALISQRKRKQLPAHLR